MTNKKAGVPFTTIILIILILGIIITLGVAYILFFDEGGYQVKATDAFCSISTSGKNFAGAFPEFCKTRPVLITPDNWDECPYYKDRKEDAEKTANRVFKDWSLPAKQKWWNDCTSEQFAKLAVHCWQLMGEGEADRGYFECYSACVSSEKALDNAKERVANAREEYEDANEEHKGITASLSTGLSQSARDQALSEVSDRIKKADKELDASEKALGDLENLPEVAINIKNIIEVMETANIEGEEITYSEVLKPGDNKDDCCLSEAGFWDEVLRESSFVKAARRGNEALKGKILEGQVISIYFSDDFGGPLGILPRLGDDRIVLRYKTEC